MKKFKIVLIIISIALIAVHVHGQGVKFEESLSWNQIIDKAKKGKKYIFIDVYASWCVPCKKMDREVYSNSSLSEITNNKFVSLKLQMDSTKNDNEQVVKFRLLAKEFEKKYKIASYPTYLFFDPSGFFIGRYGGYKSVNDFKNILLEISDPSKNILGILKNFKNNKYPVEQLGDVALKVNSLGNPNEALKIAKVYKSKYLDKLHLDSVVTRSRKDFILRFSSIVTPSDNFFKVCYNYPRKVDSILGIPDVAVRIVDNVIGEKIIKPKLYKNDTVPIRSLPQWNTLSKMLTNKFDKETAQRNLLTWKLYYYYNLKQWPEAADAFFEKVETTGIQSFGNSFNAYIWKIFVQNISDTQKLSKASIYMAQFIAPDVEKPYYNVIARIDTYANLLYKVGKLDEAISWQQKGVDKIKDLKGPEASLPNLSNIRETLEKMKRGEKIW